MTKQQPTRRRVEARRDQRAHGERLRDWIQRRQADLERRRAKKREEAERDKPARPERVVVWVHQHTAPSRGFRRSNGKRVTGSGNTPYVNPDRDKKSLKAGRLRRELRP